MLIDAFGIPRDILVCTSYACDKTHLHRVLASHERGTPCNILHCVGKEMSFSFFHFFSLRMSDGDKDFISRDLITFVLNPRAFLRVTAFPCNFCNISLCRRDTKMLA